MVERNGYDNLIADIFQKIEKIVAINSELREEHSKLSSKLNKTSIESSHLGKLDETCRVLKDQNAELKLKLEERTSQIENLSNALEASKSNEILAKKETMELSSKAQESIKGELEQLKQKYKQKISELGERLEISANENKNLSQQVSDLTEHFREMENNNTYGAKHALVRYKLETILEKIESMIGKLNQYNDDIR